MPEQEAMVRLIITATVGAKFEKLPPAVQMLQEKTRVTHISLYSSFQEENIFKKKSNHDLLLQYSQAPKLQEKLYDCHWPAIAENLDMAVQDYRAHSIDF